MFLQLLSCAPASGHIGRARSGSPLILSFVRQERSLCAGLAGNGQKNEPLNDFLPRRYKYDLKPPMIKRHHEKGEKGAFRFRSRFFASEEFLLDRPPPFCLFVILIQLYSF